MMIQKPEQLQTFAKTTFDYYYFLMFSFKMIRFTYNINSYKNKITPSPFIFLAIYFLFLRRCKLHTDVHVLQTLYL